MQYHFWIISQDCIGAFGRKKGIGRRSLQQSVDNESLSLSRAVTSFRTFFSKVRSTFWLARRRFGREAVIILNFDVSVCEKGSWIGVLRFCISETISGHHYFSSSSLYRCFSCWFHLLLSVTIHQSIPLNDLKKLNTSDTFRYLHHRIGPWIFVYLSLFGALSQVWTTIINGRAIKTTPEQSSLQEEEEPDVLRLWKFVRSSKTIGKAWTPLVKTTQERTMSRTKSTLRRNQMPKQGRKSVPPQEREKRKQRSTLLSVDGNPMRDSHSSGGFGSMEGATGKKSGRAFPPGTHGIDVQRCTRGIHID